MGEHGGFPVSSMIIGFNDTMQMTTVDEVFIDAVILCMCHKKADTTNPVVSKIFWRVMAFGENEPDNIIKIQAFRIWSHGAGFVQSLLGSQLIDINIFLTEVETEEKLKWDNFKEMLSIGAEDERRIRQAMKNQQIIDCLYRAWINCMRDALHVYLRVCTIYKEVRGSSQEE